MKDSKKLVTVFTKVGSVVYSNGLLIGMLSGDLFTHYYDSTRSREEYIRVRSCITNAVILSLYSNDEVHYYVN